jgi:transposase
VVDGALGRALAAAVQKSTDDHVAIAFVDQGYTGDNPAPEAAALGIRLEVVKFPEAKRGFVPPRGGVVGRSFARLPCLRRLARDYERLPELIAGLHLIAFSCLLPLRTRAANLPAGHPISAPSTATFSGPTL